MYCTLCLFYTCMMQICNLNDTHVCPMNLENLCFYKQHNLSVIFCVTVSGVMTSRGQAPKYSQP